MGTPAGFTAFMKNHRVNQLFKAILDEYGAWLMSSDSCGSLVADKKGGWFTLKGLEAMDGFVDLYECNPAEKHYGFSSFDAFFTRTFRDGIRLIAEPENPFIIANACENTPLKLHTNIQREDVFWAKKQPYSLQHILDGDPNVDKFVGGTIFQGYLSPANYHRFHAPVSGRIVTSRVVEGTYFSQPFSMDGSATLVTSQSYLAHVAARGIIIIDTEVEELGYVAFVPIGMMDVSTVDLEMIKGKERVTKGDNIGTFHFGGSTHLLIFEKKAKLTFDFQGIPMSVDGTEVLKVNSKIATVNN